MVTKKWDFPLLSLSGAACGRGVKVRSARGTRGLPRSKCSLGEHKAEGLRAGSHCQCTAQADRSVQSSQGRLGCAEARTQAAACDFSCCPAVDKQVIVVFVDGRASHRSHPGFRSHERETGTTVRYCVIGRLDTIHTRACAVL